MTGYSIRTEKSYVSWIKRFILFPGKRDPHELGTPEIEAFFSHIELRPENEAYKTNRYRCGELLIQGKVIGVQRGPEHFE